MAISFTILVLTVCFHHLHANEVLVFFTPPIILIQPPAGEVLFRVGSSDEDHSFNLECEAISNPEPLYRWTKNGKPFDIEYQDNRIFQIPGTGTLKFVNTTDSDAGEYQCFAQNELGIATSNTVSLRKAYQDSFAEDTIIIKSVTANEGEPFKLSCVTPPEGWPKPQILWVYRHESGRLSVINNSRITVDPEGNLWFSNVTRLDSSDDFTYGCVAHTVLTNNYSLGTKISLSVLPLNKPVSNKHEPVLQYVSRKNEVAIKGKDIELFCIFGGTPLPQTLWSKNGKILSQSHHFKQSNYGKSLIIKSVDFDDEGTYSCEVSNGVGSGKLHSINLRVLASPYFVVEPERVIVASGEIAEISCNATGVPTPKIQWTYNGRPIAESPPNTRRNVTLNSIRITEAAKSDTGNYGCKAYNALGYVYKDVYVNVLDFKLAIIAKFDIIEGVEGNEATLKCTAIGSPKPQVTWIYNSKELTGDKFEILTNGNLRITNIDFSNNGEYICLAENKFGSDNASVILTVRERTKIVQGPEDHEVIVGSKVIFRCNVSHDANLDLEIIWLHDGEPLEFDIDSRLVNEPEDTLTIIRTTESDSGLYACLARSLLDEDKASAFLIVQDKPNPPQLRAVQCNNRDATISWLPMGDNRSPILFYIIEYSTSFTPDKWEIIYDQIPAYKFNYSVPMSPWGNYTFRVTAVNKIGPSIPSRRSEVCITSPDVPYKNPDHVEGEGDRPYKLIISWDPMTQIEHNGPNFYYRVYWKVDAPGSVFETRDVFDWMQNRIVIKNIPTYTHRIKVVALNELGEANIAAKEVVVYFGENRPLLVPTNFTLIQMSATSVVLSWNPVPSSSMRGDFKGYQIEIWTDYYSNHQEIEVERDINTVLVNTLKPYTKYYAQVSVYNGTYNGPASETISFETPEGAPGPVAALKVYPVSSTAIFLRWEKPKQPNGILRGYKIYYATVNGTSVDELIERKPSVTDPDQLQAKLSGLQPNQKYRLYITAVTAVGESTKYFIECETNVLQGRLSIPDFATQYISTHDNTSTLGVRVIWLPNLNEWDVPGSYFFVEYKKVGESTYIQSNPEYELEYIDIYDVELDQPYEFILSACDDGPHLCTRSMIQYKKFTQLMNNSRK